MNRTFLPLLALYIFLCVNIDSLPIELGFDFVERTIRQQENSTSGASWSSSTGSAGQSAQIKPSEQLINPAFSSDGTLSGSGSQMLNSGGASGGASGGTSQQFSQQFSPQNFVDPSFQNNVGLTSTNSSQLSKPSSFVDPSQFLQMGSASGTVGSLQTGGNQTGTNTGLGNSGIVSSGNSQLFQPPSQFFGQGSSGQFNFFNPASFIGK